MERTNIDLVLALEVSPSSLVRADILLRNIRNKIIWTRQRLWEWPRPIVSEYLISLPTCKPMRY